MSFLIFILTPESTVVGTFGRNPYDRIWQNISQGYNKNMRPVLDPQTIVNVTITNELYRLVKLSEADETLIIIQWMYWVHAA